MKRKIFALLMALVLGATTVPQNALLVLAGEIQETEENLNVLSEKGGKSENNQEQNTQVLETETSAVDVAAAEILETEVFIAETEMPVVIPETLKLDESAVAPETSESDESAVVPETSETEKPVVVPETPETDETVAVPEVSETGELAIESDIPETDELNGETNNSVLAPDMAETGTAAFDEPAGGLPQTEYQMDETETVTEDIVIIEESQEEITEEIIDETEEHSEKLLEEGRQIQSIEIKNDPIYYQEILNLEPQLWGSFNLKIEFSDGSTEIGWLNTGSNDGIYGQDSQGNIYQCKVTFSDGSQVNNWGTPLQAGEYTLKVFSEENPEIVGYTSFQIKSIADSSIRGGEFVENQAVDVQIQDQPYWVYHFSPQSTGFYRISSQDNQAIANLVAVGQEDQSISMLWKGQVVNWSGAMEYKQGVDYYFFFFGSTGTTSMTLSNIESSSLEGFTVEADRNWIYEVETFEIPRKLRLQFFFQYQDGSTDTWEYGSTHEKYYYADVFVEYYKSEDPSHLFEEAELEPGHYQMRIKYLGCIYEMPLEVKSIEEISEKLTDGINYLEEGFYKYIPEKSGKYIIHSDTGSYEIYDSNGNALVYQGMKYSLEEAKPYFIYFRPNNNSNGELEITQSLKVPADLQPVDKELKWVADYAFGYTIFQSATYFKISYGETEEPIIAQLGETIQDGDVLSLNYILDENREWVDYMSGLTAGTYTICVSCGDIVREYSLNVTGVSNYAPTIEENEAFTISPGASIYVFIPKEDGYYFVNADCKDVRIFDEADELYSHFYHHDHKSYLLQKNKTYLIFTEVSAGNEILQATVESNAGVVTLTEGENTISASADSMVGYSFTPEDTGNYILDGYGNIDFYSGVTDISGIAFVIPGILEAGKTYFGFFESFENQEVKISVRKAPRVENITLVSEPYILSGTYGTDYDFFDYLKFQITYDDGTSEIVRDGETTQYYGVLTICIFDETGQNSIMQGDVFHSGQKYLLKAILAESSYSQALPVTAQNAEIIFEPFPLGKEQSIQDKEYYVICPAESGIYRFIVDNLQGGNLVLMDGNRQNRRDIYYGVGIYLQAGDICCIQYHGQTDDACNVKIEKAELFSPGTEKIPVGEFCYELVVEESGEYTFPTDNSFEWYIYTGDGTYYASNYDAPLIYFDADEHYYMNGTTFESGETITYHRALDIVSIEMEDYSENTEFLEMYDVIEFSDCKVKVTYTDGSEQIINLEEPDSFGHWIEYKLYSRADIGFSNPIMGWELPAGEYTAVAEKAGSQIVIHFSVRSMQEASKRLSLNDTVEFAAVNGYRHQVFSFIPEKNAEYKFTFKQEIQEFQLLDSKKNEVEIEQEQNSFSYIATLEKGENYYGLFNKATAGNVTVTVIINNETDDNDTQEECKHTWKVVVDKAATCGAAGSQHKECTVCGQKQPAEAIAATGAHTWITKVDKTATCGAAGSQHKECSVCGQKQPVEAVPATGSHHYETIVSKEATCGEEGRQYEECTVCHSQKGAETIPATNAHKYGSYKVTKEATVLAAGTKTRTCSVCGKEESVTIKKLKAQISLNVKKIPLKVKQSTTEVEVTYGKGDKIVSWKSSNRKVATVTSKGKITGKKAGKATITVKLKSGKSAKLTVTVQKTKVKTTKLKLNKKSLTLKKGKKYQLSATVTPLTSQEKVKFTTSNKKILTVTSKGKITAKKKGTAYVVVTSGSKTVRCKVKVK